MKTRAKQSFHVFHHSGDDVKQKRGVKRRHLTKFQSKVETGECHHHSGKRNVYIIGVKKENVISLHSLIL